MSQTDASSDLFASEPIKDRFEAFGSPEKGRRRIQRMVDHKTERYVAVRRLSGRIDEARVRALLALQSHDLFPLTGALRDESGPYLVGDYGEISLSERLGKGPFSEGDLQGIAISVGRAMKFLHDRGFYPIDPSAENLREATDGTVRIAAISLPINAAEAEVPGGKDPIAHDLKTLGRTLVCLATGRADADPSDTSLLPPSIADVVKRCDNGTITDATMLLALLGVSRPAAAATPQAPLASEATVSGSGVTTMNPAVDPEVTETAPPDAVSETPIPQVPPVALSPDSQADSRANQPDAFPWRPAAELYRITGDALEGGMGSVRMAIETATNRKVAIKRILMHSGMRQSSLDRFYREAHSIANLSHPHVLQLLQPGRDDEGDYLVLEWAAGGSLKDQIVKHGSVPPEKVKAIARKIGSALAYAHKKGIVHRDIKPHNILLTETGEPKLADFGLARSMVDLTLSSSRGGAGSPLYMAPEQHESTREATAQSDLYSFGKTLYQLLTGKAPTNPDPKLLPADMRSAIMRCMEEEPSLRPANAEEFLKELDQGEKPAKPVLAYALAALALIAGVVAFQAGLFSSGDRSDPVNGGPKVAINNGDQTDPNGDPNKDPQAGAGGGSSLAQASIAGILALVTGSQDGAEAEAIEPGDTTISDTVQIGVKFDRPVGEVDLDKIVVSRDDVELDAADLTIEKSDDGLILVTAPLKNGENRFSIDMGEQPDVAPELVQTTVSREYPSVALGEFEDGVKVAGDNRVTNATEVRVQGGVSGGSVGTLYLRAATADPSTAIAVPVNDNAFDFRLPLPVDDGTVKYFWFWPNANNGSNIDQDPVELTVDRTPPALTLNAPSNQTKNSFSISGKFEDRHPGMNNVALVILRDGAAYSTVSLPTTGDQFTGKIDLGTDLDDAESLLTLQAIYRDALGHEGKSSTLEFVVDKLAPDLNVPKPSFTKIGDKVKIRGTTSEALKEITVNTRDAIIGPDNTFEIEVPLDADGKYAVFMRDLASNQRTRELSGPQPATPAVATPTTVVIATPPKISVMFESGTGGIAIAVVSADKPLSSVQVGSASATNSGGVWRANVGQLLSDLRDPAWSPTQKPVVIQVTATDSSSHQGRFVAFPSSWWGSELPPEGYELGTNSGRGIYCPYVLSDPRHKDRPPASRSSTPADCFILSRGSCGWCGHKP